MIILGLDPGAKYTGYCLFQVVDSHWGPVQRGTLEKWNCIEELILRADLVVYERYLIYDNKTAAHTFSTVEPVEVIGVVKWLCEKHRVEVKAYNAGGAKRFVTDKMLRDLDLWMPGKDNRHARDATRQVIYELVRQRDPVLMERLGEMVEAL